MWHSRPPRDPPPFHGKNHLKFPFWLFEPLPNFADRQNVDPAPPTQLRASPSFCTQGGRPLCSPCVTVSQYPTIKLKVKCPHSKHNTVRSQPYKGSALSANKANSYDHIQISWSVVQHVGTPTLVLSWQLCKIHWTPLLVCCRGYRSLDLIPNHKTIADQQVENGCTLVAWFPYTHTTITNHSPTMPT